MSAVEVLQSTANCSSSDSSRSAQRTPERRTRGAFNTFLEDTQGELVLELASELRLEFVGEASKELKGLPVMVSSSESSRSAQHTPERRALLLRDSAFEGVIQGLIGELVQELMGEFMGDRSAKEARLLH